MIAKNCADILPVSLAWATANFNEVNLIVDTDNDDDTLIEAHKFDRTVLVEHNTFKNFSQQKNLAMSLASTPWVLSVDSDEIFEELEWDSLVDVMTRGGYDAASFALHNLQRDLYHYLPPVIPKVRLIRRDIAKMDGKPADEGLAFNNKRVMNFPYAMIHFGHVRNEKALKLKGKDRIKFINEDPCDGPGMKKHGEDWFIKRNEEWDKRVEKLPKHLLDLVAKYVPYINV
jgi:glycosyltransferase involved in cell wall biosynthesis